MAPEEQLMDLEVEEVFSPMEVMEVQVLWEVNLILMVAQVE